MSAGRRRLIAWSPALVVLVAGGIAWAGAFTDADAFATYALSVALLVALIAPAPSFLRARSPLGFGVGLAVKLVLFFALAPRGLSTLGRGYHDVRNDFAFWQDYLVYFWALPPALVLVTLIEGWVISLRLAGRNLRDTWVYRRRYAVLAVGTGAVVLGIGWYLGRARYYLWRVRSGNAPARYSLAKVGPRALPVIEKEIHRLGKARVGFYRSDLVSVMVDIRHDVVARRIGTPLVWKVEAAQLEVDPPLLDALRTALIDEPDHEQRGRIGTWTSELDFNTSVELLCAAFPKLPLDGQAQLANQFHNRTLRATRRSQADTSPWRSMPKAEVDKQQSAMKKKLACAVPQLVAAMEREAPGWRDYPPAWAMLSLDTLAALGPLPDHDAARLRRLVEKTNSSTFRTSLLGRFGTQLTGGDRRALARLVARVYRGLRRDGARIALRVWVSTEGEKHGVDPETFFCAVFDGSHGISSYGLVSMVKKPGGNHCVATKLMDAYGAAAVRRGAGPSWLHIALDALAARRAKDPRIEAWARELLPKLEDTRRAQQLAGLAGAEHQ